MRSVPMKVTVMVVFLVAVLFAVANTSATAQDLELKKEELGQFLYFDEDLSEPSGQSCASCHDPDFGFVDPDKGLPVSEGVIPGLSVAPTHPVLPMPCMHPLDTSLTLEKEKKVCGSGGQFWDSRATGEVLGDPRADQALGPFLNPVEMANTRETGHRRRCEFCLRRSF